MYRILIVEDERDVLSYLCQLVEDFGHSVAGTASSGETAIKLAQSVKPDVILMDIILEGDLDGIAAAAAILDKQNVRIIYLTGYSDENLLQRARLTNPSDFIVKPADVNRLRSAINFAVQHSHTANSQPDHFRLEILNSIIDGVLTTDHKGNVAYLNPTAQKMTGWGPEGIGEACTKVFNVVKQANRRMSDSSVSAELREDAILISKTGKKIPIGYSAAPLADEKGASSGFVFVFRDIAKSIQLENAMSDSKKRYKELVNSIEGVIWEADAQRIFSFVSKEANRLLGFPLEQWRERLFWKQHLHPEDQQWASGFAERAVIDRTGCEMEYRMIASDGRTVWVRDIFSVSVERNQTVTLRGVMIDITRQKQTESELRAFQAELEKRVQERTAELTEAVSKLKIEVAERQRIEEQLVHDAFHDALTSLSNRALFMDRLSGAAARAESRAKRGGQYLFAVLFLDLDRFKVINDSMGHMAGDQLLIGTARRLEKCLRPGDTIARLGGDEFALLIEDIAEIKDIQIVAERVLNELNKPHIIEGNEVFASASIGIALSSSGFERGEDLLRDADTAMYHAKSRGKARYEFFDDSMHGTAVALLHLETDLRHAVDRNEFVIYYQPIVSLKNRRVTGFEALVRWQHPERGILSPAEVIPLAEETGLILPIGMLVLQNACAQMRQWQSQFPLDPPLHVSINLSGKQFQQPEIDAVVARTLSETGLDARSLKLEITESVIMENAEIAVSVLQKLRALKVQLLIDDFGTGYSSLSYLHRFPINTLKIDRSFVNRIGKDGENWEIVQTILTLANNLGMEVVAEGVETEQQRVKLLSLGCHYGQGYLFSRPLDSQLATELISGLWAAHTPPC